MANERPQKRHHGDLTNVAFDVEPTPTIVTKTPTPDPPKVSFEIWEPFASTDVSWWLTKWPVSKFAIDVEKATASIKAFLGQEYDKGTKEIWEAFLQCCGLVRFPFPNYETDQRVLKQELPKFHDYFKTLYETDNDIDMVNDTEAANETWTVDTFIDMVVATPSLRVKPKTGIVVEQPGGASHTNFVKFVLESNKFPEVAQSIYQELISMSKVWNIRNFFSPQTAMIQSSGIGKSFQSLWIGQEHCFAFYICCRKDENGFPLRSLVSDYIENPLAFKGALTVFAG